MPTAILKNCARCQNFAVAGSNRDGICRLCIKATRATTPLAEKIIAECRPGRSDEDVARLLGCAVSTVVRWRCRRGIPAGRLKRKDVVAVDAHAPVPWLELARALGLVVRVLLYESPLWVVTDVRTGKDRGSYVPATGSVHVIGRPGTAQGVTDPEAALKLFATRTA